MVIDFIKKYEQLKQSIPVPAISLGELTQNSQLIDYVYRSNNCYHCFDSYHLENSIYCSKCYGKEMVDCDYCVESELCYQCVESDHCYHSTYLLDCYRCQNCDFCSMCISCSDCFGCVGLSHKKYCMFNKQYSQEEYKKKLIDLKKEPPQKNLQKMFTIRQQVPHPQSHQYNNENCPYGDYIRLSKNSYWCFDTWNLENCGYVFEGGAGSTKECWDMYFSGVGSELCYQMVDTSSCYHCAYLEDCGDCNNCYYGFNCNHCSDCFGCVGLQNKKYCILNNQLSKEKYQEAVAEIKKELGWKT